MYPVVGNSSSDDQKKPVAKYIHTDLNSTRNLCTDIAVERRLGIPSTSTGEIPSPSKEDTDICIPKERLLAGGCVGDNQNDSGSDGLAVAAYPSSSIQDHPSPRGGSAGDDSDERNDDVLMTKKRKEKKREKSSDIDLDSTRGADAVHIEMGSVAEDEQDEKCKVENNQSEEKPRIAADVIWSLDEIIKSHLSINKYNFCKCENESCENCQLVKEKFRGYCDKSNLNWAPVVEYHRKTCQFCWCKICTRLKDKTPIVVVQQNKRLARIVAGLDQEDSIICRNDVSSDLTHFKAGSDFHFKGKTCFAEGSSGEAWDIDIDESVKGKFSSNCTCFVLKKSNSFTEDEKYIYDKKIANHPNIVKTFLVVCKKERNFTHRIVMERCGHKSVDDYVYKRRYQMEIDEAKFYWLQVVDAVVHLHSKNVIHMDITLANILFRDDGRVQLADFGRAERLYEGCSGRDFSGIATPYTAPEVLDEKVYGRPADIYSLGMSFLQMLGYALSDVDELKRRDKDMGELIESCLDECPSERPTAREIQKKLEI